MGTWSGSQKQVRPFHPGAQELKSQATEHTESHACSLEMDEGRVMMGGERGSGLLVPVFSNKNPAG